MKVAVPVENGVVSPRFARAPAFALYEVGEKDLQLVETMTNPYMNEVRGAGPLIVQMLVNAGVEAVVAANVGPNAFEALRAVGMKFYPVPPGIPVEQAVKSIIGGGTPPRFQAITASNFTGSGYSMGYWDRKRGMGRRPGQGAGYGRGMGRRCWWRRMF